MLNQSCETLVGVGPKIATLLNKCGIHTIADLLFHLPFRYQDRTRITPIQDLRPDDWSVIAGNLCHIEIKSGRRPILNCDVEDKTGIIRLRFFHFNKALVSLFQKHSKIRAFGQVHFFANHLEMIHPEYHFLDQEEVVTVEETLTPIYPATLGLTQTRLRQLIKKALETHQKALVELEWMSEDEQKFYDFLPMKLAIEQLHHPPPQLSLQTLEDGSHPALKRLVFDELLAERICMQFAKRQRNQMTATALPKSNPLLSAFLKQLPFQLTKAQELVIEEIQHDLSQTKPMLRLVQGDVGCGKTVIAATAALTAIAHHHQVAFMAPTDILTEQHVETLTRWFSTLDITVYRLTGSMSNKERKEVLSGLSSHQAHIVVGTHALFQKNVQFSKLGLVIIDEQHRFGVIQRLSLQQKGQQEQCPHQLFLTATPIPRTLAMTRFAHLDLSIINELPKGRAPIITAVLNQEKRQPIMNRLKKALESGRQAYWVCPLIDESEKLQCIAATTTATRLQEELQNLNVGLVHGRMSTQEKENAMAAFKRGETHLLVATTVVEVGVDVPNASLMIIENAERLGLSQLHQLRGRIGRGSTQSYCLLLYHPPLTELGAKRLQVMKSTQDGFIIAEKDLQLRGGGEFLGTKQAGWRQYKIAAFPRDQYLLSPVADMAHKMVHERPKTAQKIVHCWRDHNESFLQG